MAVNHVVNKAGVSFLRRVMRASTVSVAAVVAAYLRVEHEAEAGAARARILASGLSASDETAVLLELEQALESLTLATLNGGTTTRPSEALAPVLARLEA